MYASAIILIESYASRVKIPEEQSESWLHS